MKKYTIAIILLIVALLLIILGCVVYPVQFNHDSNVPIVKDTRKVASS